MVTRTLLVLTMAAGIFSGTAIAQEKTVADASAETRSYDLQREVTLTGTVQSFIEAAETAPRGAHVILQTSSGTVDVHLGDARLLAAHQFTIHSGDTLRIIGETVAYANGTQFVARIVQKGTQVLAVRSVRGIPLSYMAPRTEAKAKPQGGAL